jgi:hypothetical protein
MDIASHFDAVKASFLLNRAVGSFMVKEEEIRNEDGFIRVRARMRDGSAIEAFEFAVSQNDEVEVISYRIHWQDKSGHLIKRWDCSRHHSHLSNFPYHVHIGLESHVEATGKLDIQVVLGLITRSIQE